MAGPVMRETGCDSEKGASMAEPTTRRRTSLARASSDGAAGYEQPTREPSLGDLVALAVSDLTQLVKCEIDLAKIELKRDGLRLGLGGLLLVLAAFFGCLILMLLSFAFAYGLQAVGAPGGAWGSFLWVALAWFLLALGAVAFGVTRFRHLTGLRKTRVTVSEDLALIRSHDSHSPAESAKAR